MMKAVEEDSVCAVETSGEGGVTCKPFSYAHMHIRTEHNHINCEVSQTAAISFARNRGGNRERSRVQYTHIILCRIAVNVPVVVVTEEEDSVVEASAAGVKVVVGEDSVAVMVEEDLVVVDWAEVMEEEEMVAAEVGSVEEDSAAAEEAAGTAVVRAAVMEEDWAEGGSEVVATVGGSVAED